MKHLLRCIVGNQVLSLPTRECGLKLDELLGIFNRVKVTPHAGVWIETDIAAELSPSAFVTPHAGVWIETHPTTPLRNLMQSLPTRECGLKPLIQDKVK